MIGEIELFLLKRGAHRAPLEVTTAELAQTLGMPQQTLSRHLIALEQDGRIRRSQKGISLTEKSLKEAAALKHDLEISLKAASPLQISGEVASGIGEGKYYMSLPGYKSQIEKRYNFSPYPGTLNIKLPPEEIQKRLLLRERKGDLLAGFTYKGKDLGGLISYECHLNGMPSVAIFPEKSQHGLNIIEIIGPIEFRRKLALKDGETVHLSFE